MDYLKSFKNSKIKNSIICIGVFDGLHKGHMKIINETLKIANKNDLQKIFFTFHLPENLKKNTNIIYEKHLKEEIVKNLGFDFYYEFDLTNSNNLKMDKLKFMHFLYKELLVRKIVIGNDFKFAYKRSGNKCDLINYFGKENIFEVNLLTVNGNKISSQMLKSAIENNDFSFANKYLFVNYHCSGEVIYGKQLASKLGFPTANLKLSNKLIIKSGSYIGITEYKNKLYPSMIYYDKNYNIIESHLLNEKISLYNKFIKIYFLSFLEKNEKLKDNNEIVAKLNRCFLKTVDYFKK